MINNKSNSAGSGCDVHHTWWRDGASGRVSVWPADLCVLIDEEDCVGHILITQMNNRRPNPFVAALLDLMAATANTEVGVPFY